MRGRLPDNVRIRHVLDAITEVEKYIAGISFNDFLQSSEKKYATIKQIEIIGEACNSLSVELRDAHPEIPWKPIRGFRNLSIHEYFGVNFQLVWEIAANDLPVEGTIQYRLKGFQLIGLVSFNFYMYHQNSNLKK